MQQILVTLYCSCVYKICTYTCKWLLSYYLHVSHVWKKHLYLLLPRLHFYFISSKFTLFLSLVYQLFKTSLSFRTQLLTMTCFNPNLPLLASLCAFIFLSNPAHCSDTFLLSNTFYSLTFFKFFLSLLVTFPETLNYFSNFNWVMHLFHVSALNFEGFYKNTTQFQVYYKFKYVVDFRK